MTLLYLWVGGALCAQSTQLHFKQFTTEDGLPSSETYVVFEDQEGYIWIGTDNGVARYDGYEFEVFDSNDGLDDVVVFTILEDDVGKIWVGTFSGDAYYFEDGKFHPYRFNQEVQAARMGNEFVHLIDVRKTGELVFRLQHNGVFFVGNHGEVAPVKMSDLADFFYYTPECSGALAGKLAPIARNMPIETVKAWGTTYLEARIIFGNNTCSREIMKFKSIIPKAASWPIKFITSFNEDENEKVLIWIIDEMTIHEEGKERSVTSMEGSQVYFILPVSNDAIWLGLGRGDGLQYLTLDSLNQIVERRTYLKGRSISYLAKDRRGGLWATSTDAGVFYCPFPKQRKYILNNDVKPISIAVTGDDDFYAGFEDQAVFHYKGKERVGTEMQLTNRWNSRPDFMIFDTVFNRLFTSGSIIEHYQHSGEELASPSIKPYRIGYENALTGARRVSFSSTTGPRRLLVANYHQFGIFDLDEVRTQYVSPRDETINGIYTFWISPRGQYLLGTTNGLMEYDPAQPDVAPNPINFGAEELDTRIVDIKEYKGGVIFATRGEGIVYLKDGVKKVVKEQNGLASDMI